MTTPPTDLGPRQAWEPLSKFDWDRRSAMHLLRRTGFSSTPAAVAAAFDAGMEATVRSSFREAEPMPEPESFSSVRGEVIELRRQIRGSRGRENEEKRRELSRNVRRLQDSTFDDLTIGWLRHARKPQNSAQEKFVLFLQDVFVVARQKTRDPEWLYNYQRLLREGIGGGYPELCKAVSRDRAMVRYLDLNRSSRQKPNENFARELFELFTLGEGNYTEQDIKQAARAFTGYRHRGPGEFFIAGAAHDDGEKTVFGRSGNWDGDDVIDIVFEQPASRTFLPREMMKYYLGEPLPDPACVEALGDGWAESGFNLTWLAETFFQSRLFYHPAYRGNLIKSPVHFYLGICQDLSIEVAPFPRLLRPAFRGMGQDLFNPPNVRGWLYGPHWINSTTVTARRGVVDYVFEPIDDKRLNGDEKKALTEAAEKGLATVVVPEGRLESLLGNDHLADHVIRFFFAEGSPKVFRETTRSVLDQARKSGSTDELAACLVALMQSPAYNLS